MDVGSLCVGQRSMTITVTIFNIMGNFCLIVLLVICYTKMKDREMHERHKKLIKEANDNIRRIDELRKKYQTASMITGKRNGYHPHNTC